jgi:hypothetical protein
MARVESRQVEHDNEVDAALVQAAVPEQAWQLAAVRRELSPVDCAKGSRILVEPSHSAPPTGSYLQPPNFYGDYVMWGARRERHDYYSMYTLDTYAFLYGQRATSAEKRDYILSRLDLVDYIVIDEFHMQLYRHLPDAEYGVVKRYSDELFGGQLGVDLAGTFKVYPSLFGVPISTMTRAELSSRMNDHPRVYVFVRRHSRTHRLMARSWSTHLADPYGAAIRRCRVD